MICVCSDGDSTYVQKLAETYDVLADPGVYDMRLPLHRQEGVHQKITIPGTDAGYCIDIDHQGKSMRYLIVDGQWLTVFPRFSGAYYSFDVNVDVLRELGLPAVCMRRDVAGKMDDLLAAKLYSGPNLIRIGEQLRFAVQLIDSFPLGDPESEQEFAAACSFLEELRQDHRVRAAAYWLFVPWVCAYQTIHGVLSPADRLLAASYAFCTVLFMVVMRDFVSREFIPLERKSQVSGKKRWGVSNESCKKLLVTLSTIIRHLGDVSAPIRANAFGTLSAERLFSCIRRVCKSNDHFLNVMSMLRLTVTMTKIRADLGLSPDLEEGTKRQKHGDVLFQPLPPGYEGMPMCRIMSLVLTAMLRSGVRFPKALLIAWAGLDVLELPESEPCFIEDLVDISQERRPVHATLRNTRTVAFGGLGQCKRWASAHQVAHAADGVANGPTAGGLVAAADADGGVDAPTPPALVRLWPSPERTADEPLFPFDAEPPKWQ